MDYKPGLVAASLNQGKKKTEPINPVLVQLFSKTTEKPNDITTTTKKKTSSSKNTHEQSKKGVNISIRASTGDLDNKASGKRKIEASATGTKTKKAKKDVKSESESNSNPSSNIKNDFPYVHESLLSQNNSSECKTKNEKKSKKQQSKLDDDNEFPLSRRSRRRRDKTADKRTIFVGNCPLTADKKVMTKLFKTFGAIESMRFRCGPAAKLELPRRAVIIKKEFHENASSFVCYIVFKEEESAQNALQMNGHVLGDLHLRVDLASNHKKHDKKRSVFVGNLPFAITEEDLRCHFQDCGDIDNVRIIRDRQTSIGKGIAYVQFESKDGVTLAKKLNEKEFQGRKLRVMTCTNKPVKTVGNSRMNNKISNKSSPHPAKKKISYAPSNKHSSKSFHEILQAKKEKRQKKMKKKKTGGKKSDGLSSIFGDMSADMKRLKMENPKLKEKKQKDKKFKAKKDKKVNRLKKKS